MIHRISKGDPRKTKQRDGFDSEHSGHDPRPGFSCHAMQDFINHRELEVVMQGTNKDRNDVYRFNSYPRRQGNYLITGKSQ